MLDLEIHNREIRQAIDTPPHTDWEPDRRITDHIQEVVTLSGESYDTIKDFYLAYLVLLQRMNDFVGQFCQALVEEKEDLVPKGKAE